MGEFAIGQAVTRTEDPRLLRGGGRYVDDLTLPNTAYGVVLRAAHAHAKVAKINVKIGSGTPGHEKADPIRQIKRLKPDVIVIDWIKGRPRAWIALSRPVLPGYETRVLVTPNSAVPCLVKRSMLSKLGPAFRPMPAAPQRRPRPQGGRPPSLF